MTDSCFFLWESAYSIRTRMLMDLLTCQSEFFPSRRGWVCHASHMAPNLQSRHSCLSATMGSTRIARLAGRYEASEATAVIKLTANRIVIGS